MDRYIVKSAKRVIAGSKATSTTAELFFKKLSKKPRAPTVSNVDTEIITIESSGEITVKKEIEEKRNPSPIERETCQMSPLLFDSDSEDEHNFSGNKVATPTQQSTYQSNTIESSVLSNQEYFQIISGAQNISRQNKSTNVFRKKRSFSEPPLRDSYPELMFSNDSRKEAKLLNDNRKEAKLIIVGQKAGKTLNDKEGNVSRGGEKSSSKQNAKVSRVDNTDEKVSRAGKQNERGSRVANKDEKVSRVANKDEKISRVANKDEKDSRVVNKDTKGSTVANKDKKVTRATNINETALTGAKEIAKIARGNEKDSTSNNKSKVVTKIKIEESDDSIDCSPRVTRGVVRRARITTRSKLCKGDTILTLDSIKLSKTQKNGSGKKRGRAKRNTDALIQPEETQDSIVNMPDNQQQIEDTGNENTVPFQPSEFLQPEKRNNKYDFDLNIRLTQRRSSSASTDLQILSQKNVCISLTSSSECADSQPSAAATNKRTQFEKQLMCLSPDLFDTFDEEETELPKRKSFFRKSKPNFFDNLLNTSTPNHNNSKSSLNIHSDSSLDMFSESSCDDYPSKPKKKKQSDDSKKNVFEITKNDIFSNRIRINSDTEMSPIQVSDDDEDDDDDRETYMETPVPKAPVFDKKKQTTCFDGLTIRKRTNLQNANDSNTTRLDMCIEEPFAQAPIDMSSSSVDVNDCIIPATPLQITPKRPPLTPTKRRRCRTEPHRKKKPTGRPIGGSGGVLDGIAKWLQKGNPSQKQSSSQETPKRYRRLDFWFKEKASNKLVHESKESNFTKMFSTDEES